LDQLSLPARFLITAGAANEEAIVSDRWDGSLFTDVLINLTKEYASASVGPVSIYRLFDDIQQRIVIEKQRAGWREQLTPQLKDLQGGGGAFFFTAAGIAPGTREAPAKPQPSKATPKSGVGIPAAHTSGDVPRSPVTDGNSEEFALARGQSKLVTKDKIVMAVIGIHLREMAL
jgi:hypothetical protein